MSARQGDGKMSTPTSFGRLATGLLLALVQVLAGGTALAQTVTIGPRTGATLLPLLGLNVGYEYGSVETYEYGALAGSAYSENGIPLPYMDYSQP